MLRLYYSGTGQWGSLRSLPGIALYRCCSSEVLQYQAGISRSATVVLMHMMRSENLGANDAIERLREIRPVNPNPGFRTQLDVFEVTLR